MTDSVDIFLGDLKCTLQRFRPQPGDVFILTIPEIPSEQEERFRTEANKYLGSETKVLVITGGATVDLEKAN